MLRLDSAGAINSVLNLISGGDIMSMSTGSLPRRHQRTLAEIFAEPTPADVRWDDIRSLFGALKADCSEGRGSRLRVALGDRKAVFHKPHPRKEASKSLVRSVRRFLEEAGIGPEGR